MTANPKVLTYLITGFPIVFDIENDVAHSQIKKHNQQFNYPHLPFPKSPSLLSSRSHSQTATGIL